MRGIVGQGRGRHGVAAMARPLSKRLDRRKRIPEKWSLSKNIRWAAEMPGRGCSTPVVRNNRLFVTSTDRHTKDLYAICLNARTGNPLWRKILAQAGSKVSYNNDASPSPIVDTERVYFLFSTGDFLATNYDGHILWSRNLEKDLGPLTITFRYSASPLLYKGRLYLSILRDNTTKRFPFYKNYSSPLDSYLLCVDPSTGCDIWKIKRSSEAEGIESRESYATPIVWEHADDSEIILTGANYVTGHDWKTGEETWRMGYVTKSDYRLRAVSSPVVAGDILVCATPRFNSVFAVPMGLQGRIPTNRVLWRFEDNTLDVTCPLYFEGRLYILQGVKKTMTCLNPRTGAKIWEGKIGGDAIFHASPTGADGKIYCINRAGQVVVLAAGDKFRILSRISMKGEPCSSSIIAADGRLFIRTGERLYCVAK